MPLTEGRKFWETAEERYSDILLGRGNFAAYQGEEILGAYRGEVTPAAY